MAFDLNTIETRLQLLDWRDSQLEAITGQLEDAFPSLEKTIETRLSEMTTLQVARAQLSAKPLAESIISPWAAAQGLIALKRAEESLTAVVTEMNMESSIGDHIHTALPALAGVGVLAASVAGLPAVVSFATVTSSFLFISTSSISVPLLLVGGVALTGLSLAGFKGLDYAKDKSRARLAARILAEAQAVIFGQGLAPNSRCLVNDLQAIVLKAGVNKLEEIA
ncbi:hypothetical protein [Thioclava sp.]|uniref:hypothetical protein n=1 Tax=Thioclava sp. TaxID=1933450 RepID=UPI003AA90E28